MVNVSMIAEFQCFITQHTELNSLNEKVNPTGDKEKAKNTLTILVYHWGNNHMYVF